MKHLGLFAIVLIVLLSLPPGSADGRSVETTRSTSYEVCFTNPNAGHLPGSGDEGIAARRPFAVAANSSPAKDNANSSPVEEGANSSRVEEDANASPAKEGAKSSPVEEDDDSSPVEEGGNSEPANN
jgi:hypothetical protein